MKKVVLLIFLIVFAAFLACKDKNAQSSDRDISSLPIHTNSPTDPRSVASKLETATSAVKDQNNLVWAGDVDLVCQMKIDQSVKDTIHFDGKIYGFCSESCKGKFQKDPRQWISKKGKD